MTSAQATTRPYLWLHIKKSAGQSIRAGLGGNYVETDRSRPRPFAELPTEEWNDALNNYRMDLQGYEVRRMLFARDYLFDDLGERYCFAFVRNPFDRAVSAWRYLSQGARWRDLHLASTRRSFRRFLMLVEQQQTERTHRHVFTHTAPMWPDVSDDSGRLLLDFVGRFENLEHDYASVCRELAIQAPSLPRRNVSDRPMSYRSAYDRETRAMVESLYGADLERFDYDF